MCEYYQKSKVQVEMAIPVLSSPILERDRHVMYLIPSEHAFVFAPCYHSHTMWIGPMKYTELPHREYLSRAVFGSAFAFSLIDYNGNKEASWLHAELKSHISFQVSFVVDLKLSDETWNEMCYLKLFETWVAYLKLSDETWKRGGIWNFWNLKLFKPIMGGRLFQTFRWYLKWDVLFETLQTFQTHHKSCLFYTFRWLETRYAIWNVWNLKLFKHVMGGCLFETFRWYLKWDVLFETFQTFQLITGVSYLKLSDKTWSEMCYLKLFNLFKPIMRAAYLKLSDETWNKIFYLKHLKLETFQTCHGSCLFETFRWDLKKRCYLKLLKLETFQTHHGGRGVGCLFETFRWDLKQDMLFETF